MKVGNNISTSLTLNNWAPQGCMLSPLLYSLFTHDCVAMNAANSIIKFAEDTTVVGLITNDETAHREEVRALGVWCQENILSFNVNKTKEMIVDFKKQQREHPPIHIEGIVVEKVERLMFLSVHITDKLKWSTLTDSVVKKAQQRLFNLRRLKKFGLSPKTLTNFYRCTIESILSGGTATAPPSTARLSRGWSGLYTASPGTNYLPSRHPMSQEGQKDHQGQQPPKPRPVHPATIQEARSVQVHQAGTERLKNSFYLNAIRLLNSNH
jgi:hypothetical protein